MKRPMSRILALVSVAGLLSVYYSSSTPARVGASQDCVKCGDSSNQHVLFGTYYNVRDFSASLLLNNKGPYPLPVGLTAFSPKGEPFDLGIIELEGVSAKTFSLNQLLAAAPSTFREGSVELRYSYDGCQLVLSAGIVLEDAAAGVSFDELLARPAEFTSNRLEAVWWVPSHRSKMELVVASRSSESIAASIEVRSLGVPCDKRTLEVVFQPHESRIVNIPKALAIEGLGQQEWAAGSITVQHTGKPGDLIARGMVEDRAVRYSSVIEFGDPASGKGSELHASGLRLGVVAGQPLAPVVIMRNLAEIESKVDVRVPYTDGNGATESIVLDPVVLAPGEVRNVSPELKAQTKEMPVANIVSAGLEVAYSTAPGTVLVFTQAVSNNGDHVFRAPMVDPETKGSAGNYPWKLDDSTSTYIYLKNVTASTHRYTVQVDFEGGSYVLGLQELAPHATLALDLRALRDGQQPDQHSNVIPIDATAGQVRWSMIGPDNHAMIGRSEYVSPTHGIASTFACSNCCPNSYYLSFINPDPAVWPFQEFTYFSSYEQDKDCFGAILAQYLTYPGNWYSNNTSIVSINAGTGTANGIAPGSTSVGASWPAYTWMWIMPGPGGCRSTLVIAAPGAAANVVRVSISGDYNKNDGETANFRATVQGATPTSYQWSFTAPSGAGNNPHVNFGTPTAASTSGSCYWFAYPNTACTAPPSATYTIKCIVGFASGYHQAATWALTVNVPWNPAGEVSPVNPSIVSGDVSIIRDSSLQLWKVVSTTYARAVQKHVYVPSSSQFYNKVNSHESAHVSQFGSGGIMVDLWLISDINARTLPLTDSTQQGLQNKIQNTFNNWFAAQGAIYNSRVSSAEIQAYSISDPLQPVYLYQKACGGSM